MNLTLQNTECAYLSILLCAVTKICLLYYSNNTEVLQLQQRQPKTGKPFPDNFQMWG